jgi:hypothetical protein
LYIVSNIRLWTFFKVPGFEGIIIANQWTTIAGARVEQSLITFNKGSLWVPVNPPPEELKNCDKCTLHFIGIGTAKEDQYVTGDKESNGVILSNGITSSGDENITNANLYLSRDAGYSWKRIRDGTWKFDTSNTAGLISTVKWDSPTNTISYTRDQGENWSDCLFHPDNNRTHTAVRILTDLAPQNRSVWLVTEWNSTDGNRGYSIFHMDFNNKSIPFCSESDYEYFTPSGNGNDCVLGKNITVKRRKQDSICYVDLTASSEIIVEPCQCTRLDYYCSYCFAPNSSASDLSCTLVDSPACQNALDPPSSCVEGEKYYVYPYKKVVGNVCVNEIEEYTIPFVFNCPNTSNPNNDTSNPASKDTIPYIVLGVILAVLFIAALAFVLYKFYQKRQSAAKFKTLNEL